MNKKRSSLFTLIFLLIAIGVALFLVNESNKSIARSERDSRLIVAQYRETPYQKIFPFKMRLWEEKREQMILLEKTFLEIDLTEMKSRLYQDGKKVRELPILARGNISNWGGSPVGLYTVLNKYMAAYSNSTEVYMPFAIHYYGKYFLHGVPYYPSGETIYSRFSGGCLRYLDEDAKKIFDFVEEEMPILVIDNYRDDFEYPEKKELEPVKLSAESFLVADIQSGDVLIEKNSWKRIPIASITKLMTAIVVSENIGLNRGVIIKNEMLDVYGSNPGIEEGEVYQMIELLYPLLTRSSNQSAEALTGFLGREKTINLMNEKARSLMMNQTSFADPSGLDSRNISSPQDLFYLARYIHNNFPAIFSITKGKILPQVETMRFDLDELGNRNIFIYDSTFVGGKTGFTNASGQTALFVFNFKNGTEKRDIAIILLRSKNVKNDTQAIYKWLLENYFNNG